MERRRIWKIVGGKAQELLEQVKRDREEHRRRASEMKERYKARGTIASGRATIGIIVDADETRRGWRQMRGEKKGWLVPDNRTKEGKAIVAEIAAANKLINDEGERFFNGETWHLEDMHMFLPTVGHVGDVWVATLHKEAKATPVDGLVEIQLSEYYAMVEAIRGCRTDRASAR